jgi:hypothetical protein
MYELRSKERLDITRSLRKDGYTLKEIAGILDRATFKRTPDGVLVIYDNGAKDRFVYTRGLVRESDL